MMVAPQAQEMTFDQMLEGEGVILKQLNSLCCRVLCCQPNLHWTIHPYHSGQTFGFEDVHYNGVWIQEDASWCGRTLSCAAPGSRATAFRTIAGVPDANAPPVASAGRVTHSKGCTFGTSQLIAISDGGPIYMPCCCFLPYLETTDEKGTVLGRTEMEFNPCLAVPMMGVRDASGRKIYTIKPDTCFCGLCVVCKCGGAKGKCCKVPFLIREPAPWYQTGQQVEDAAITDLWAGFANACCTRRMLWSVKFPSTASRATRAVLVGSAILLDIAKFEDPAS